MDNSNLKQKIASAPEDIKEILYSFDVVDLVEKISTENSLTETASVRLGKEITLTLVGITKKTEFLNKIISFGINQNIAKKIESEVEEKIFNKVKESLNKLQNIQINIGPEAPKIEVAEQPMVTESKDEVLKGIENPTPTKPIVQAPVKQNPIGNNPILDAQHNLPAQEKKILISSSAVPSRGPILGNFKPIFSPTTNTPEKTPVAPVSATPVAQVAPIASTPKPIQPTTSPTIQPQKPAQTPIPPAPQKYSVDPYREPTE